MDVYRIAVLECDTPLQPIVERSGTYGDIFREFLQQSLAKYAQHARSGRIRLQVMKSNVVEDAGFPDLKSVDCVLLTGSKYNSWEDHPWILRLMEFVRKAHRERSVRLVGICFGHQIIARALGSKIGRNIKGWELSVGEVQLTDVGKKLFGKDILSLHQMHRDVVLHLPKGCQNIGYSPLCETQGLYQPGQVFSVQAHPEFDKFIMDTILDTRYEQKVFDNSQYAAGKTRNRNHDGILVGIAIWKFLLEE